jgi:transposase
VQRFEVFTGVGRRSDWPAEVQVSIVAESFSGLETVCAVARRHGPSPSQLFTWRGELRKQLEGRGQALPIASFPSPSFVPAVIEPLPMNEPARAARRPRKRHRSKASAIELEIDGVAVKTGRDADAGVIAAVIEALRATR